MPGDPAAGADEYDVLVVGATPGGVACAVRAAREGLRVLLVTHEQHLGGLMHSGLQCMDTLYPGPRAPLYDEVCAALRDHYRERYGTDSDDFRLMNEKLQFEARMAEAVITRQVEREPAISVLRLSTT